MQKVNFGKPFVILRYSLNKGSEKTREKRGGIGSVLKTEQKNNKRKNNKKCLENREC